jgi:phage portal protein BeeE
MEMVKIQSADQEFIDARKFTCAEICGMFKIAPEKVGLLGNSGTYASAEQWRDEMRNSFLPPQK